MSNSQCKIGYTYVGSPLDEVLGLFGFKPERVKANECAAKNGGKVVAENQNGGPDLHYKIVATYYKIVAGK